MDLLARVIGDHRQRTLKQPVIVDNRPGAGGGSRSRRGRTARDGRRDHRDVDRQGREQTGQGQHGASRVRGARGSHRGTR